MDSGAAGTLRVARDRRDAVGTWTSVTHGTHSVNISLGGAGGAPRPASARIHSKRTIFAVNSVHGSPYTAGTMPNGCGILLYDVCAVFGAVLAALRGFHRPTISGTINIMSCEVCCGGHHMSRRSSSNVVFRLRLGWWMTDEIICSRHSSLCGQSDTLVLFCSPSPLCWCDIKYLLTCV